MKKALQTLLAVCALATVARAQITGTAWRTESRETRTPYSINPVTPRAVEFHAEKAFSAAIKASGTTQGFTTRSLEGTFQPASLAKSLTVAVNKHRPDSHPINRDGAIWFGNPEVTGTGAVGGWLHERGTNLHEAIDSLVIGAMTEIEPEESGSDIASAAESRSAPEPASYALFGVMALLGIAVAREMASTAAT